LNNTDHDRSFLVAKAMKIDAHLSGGTGDIGVKRLGKYNPGTRYKGSHNLLSRSIIFSECNPMEAIEGEWEKEGPC